MEGFYLSRSPKTLTNSVALNDNFMFVYTDLKFAATFIHTARDVFYLYPLFPALGESKQVSVNNSVYLRLTSAVSESRILLIYLQRFSGNQKSACGRGHGKRGKIGKFINIFFPRMTDNTHFYRCILLSDNESYGC